MRLVLNSAEGVGGWCADTGKLIADRNGHASIYEDDKEKRAQRVTTRYETITTEIVSGKGTGLNIAKRMASFTTPPPN